MNRLRKYDYFLSPGYIFIPASPQLLATVVTYGVAVTLFDTQKGVGGMCHFLYPGDGYARTSALYGYPALRMLLNHFLELNGDVASLRAHMVGGAGHTKRTFSLGEKNVELAKTVLSQAGVGQFSMSTGGMQGKKVLYNTNTDEILIAYVNASRSSDWQIRNE